MKIIFLTQNKITFIDDEDYERVNQYKWYYQKDYRRPFEGYAMRYMKDKLTGKLHSISMQTFIKGCKEGFLIDHIDRNSMNNQRHNLRFCTYSQNKANSISHRNTSSKYKGVYFRKSEKKWESGIKKDSKHRHLGIFESEEAAARAYDKAAVHYFGEFARLNFA